MSFSLLFTEFRRSLKNSLSSIFLCLCLGFVVVASINFKTYLEQLFTVPKWGAHVIIVPKGLTPDLAYKDILDGEPSALLPQALFETLTAQVHDEQLKQGLTSTPLEFVAFMPFKKNGVASFGALDKAAATDFFAKHESMLGQLPLEDWSSNKANFESNDKYRTNEWSSKTFYAALANGKSEYLAQLMTLINRRTVAEAFYIDNEKSDSALKLATLKNGLTFLSAFILLLALLGLFLSFQILSEQRQQIFLVLNELKVKKSVQVNFYVGQICALMLLPICLGSLIGFYFWPYLKLLL